MRERGTEGQRDAETGRYRDRQTDRQIRKIEQREWLECMFVKTGEIEKCL